MSGLLRRTGRVPALQQHCPYTRSQSACIRAVTGRRCHTARGQSKAAPVTCSCGSWRQCGHGAGLHRSYWRHPLYSARDLHLRASSINSPAPAAEPDEGLPWTQLAAIATVTLAALAFIAWWGGYTGAVEDYVGRSGLLASFSLIFASEIGDKTFFIAGLLAMRVGRTLAFTGSVAALGVMTFISVAIGYVFKSLPDVVKSSLPLGQYLGAATMLYFGIKTLRGAWEMQDEASGEELTSAQLSVDSAEARMGSSKSWWQTFFEVASIIFFAEWGDRSMVATVALGAARSPLGVTIGAVIAHGVATFIAVLCGKVLAKYISEKTVGYIGGSLFLVFAAATAVGAF